MEGFKVNLTMLACYVASVISITLKSPGTDLGGGGGREEEKKRIDLRISEKKKKGLGHNPKAVSGRSGKNFTGFQNKNKKHPTEAISALIKY